MKMINLDGTNMSGLQDLKYKFSRLNPFGKIIVINGIIFLFDFIMTHFIREGQLMNYLKLPSDAFDFILRPWTLISYGFMHSDLIHIALNMLVLYVVSNALVNLFRSKMILNIYFLGIITGGLAFLAVYNLVPKTIMSTTALLVGASAGVRALIIFLAVYMKESEVRVFKWNVKWKYIGLFLVGLDVLGLFGLNQGGNIAHLGGALLGYLYATQLQKGKDIGLGFEKFADSFMSLFKPKTTLKTVHRKKNKPNYAGKTKDEFQTFNKQKQIDIILDKISKSGYESLTAEEKEFLFKAGK